MSHTATVSIRLTAFQFGVLMGVLDDAAEDPGLGEGGRAAVRKVSESIHDRVKWSSKKTKEDR